MSAAVLCDAFRDPSWLLGTVTTLVMASATLPEARDISHYFLIRKGPVADLIPFLDSALASLGGGDA